jgi:hypothetical protein
MQTQQLSLFPELETQHSNTRKKSKPKPVIINPCCSTKRAATLLEVSTATLNRAKREGRLPYQHHTWTATLAGIQGKKRQFWKVTFNR